ncbi:F-box/FBD/LRR-repeat protein At3g14710-like isoform X2 [Primulina eburnea]|uniref:F-box/FBD/LRR-repeat protein At3g14710-like isoform X2 n=1 Tax=Primulina eburnea TaxID=1245227 RepID=UPI003C6BD847
MGENIQIDSNAGKKPRITYDDSENIITNLPECIISRILSLLPTKDAVRTCVLSKEWEYKWTSIYNIHISDGERFLLKQTRKTSFVNFVDRVFFLSRHSTLKRFYLCCRHKYDSHRIILWISAALMRNVEDMHIVYNDEGVVLPRCLFDCKSLTSLELQLPCIFRVSAHNLFSSLKILYLNKTKILSDHVPSTDRLIFDFPVLETLELQNCEWLKVNFVEINSLALTKLCVIQYLSLPEADKYRIKISRAKIAKFEYKGYFLEYFDLCTSSVFSVAVYFHCFPKDIQVVRKNGLQARSLLKGLFSGLNHLKLSGEVVEAVVQSNQRPLLPKFNMLKRLEVFTKCNSGALLELLHPMPFLKSIVLEMWCWDDYDYDEVESLPSCIVSHLKEVRFRSFSESLPDYRMAQFLWTNALRLKKIVGLRRESSEERQRKKIFGQVREESEEKEIENFWAKLKTVFKHKEHGIFVKRKKR